YGGGDAVVSEGGPRHRSVLQGVDRLAQGVGEALRVRLVGVALEGRRKLELVLDPMETGGEDGRGGEVGIDVSARDPRLGAEPVAVADDAKAARAVVVSPRERRRRPASGRVALVRVDGRGEEDGQLLEAGD